MELLNELCQISAVSGNEEALTERLEEMFKQYGATTKIDCLGNLMGVLERDADTTIMLEAHMDEVGLLIRHIDEKGFLKFDTIGGVDPAILQAQEVLIHGRQLISGVIGATPPHLQSKEGQQKMPSIRDLYIDCGYPVEEIKQLVAIGDYVSFKPGYQPLCDGRIASKALDNRIGIAVLIECLKRLHTKKLKYNLAVAATVQEEVGCRGAATIAGQINPALAFIIDVTHGTSPYLKEDAYAVGGGITIAVGPNLDRKCTEHCINYCRTHHIPFCKEVCAGNTGTDAWPIQISNAGVPCVLISVPLKYMHTPVETACLQDVQSAVDLICGVLEEGVI